LTTQPTRHQDGLLLIGSYKIFEGVLLAAAAFGILGLLHRDLAEVAFHWVRVLRVDPDNFYIHSALEKLFSISAKQLKELSAGTLIYAVLRLAEGGGLIARKRWAEILTVVSTGLFIPLEIWELVHKFTPFRLAAFLVNVAILAYLIYTLRNRH